MSWGNLAGINMIISLYSAFVRMHLEKLCPVPAPTIQERHGQTRGCPKEGHQGDQRAVKAAL